MYALPRLRQDHDRTQRMSHQYIEKTAQLTPVKVKELREACRKTHLEFDKITDGLPDLELSIVNCAMLKRHLEQLVGGLRRMVDWLDLALEKLEREQP